MRNMTLSLALLCALVGCSLHAVQDTPAAVDKVETATTPVAALPAHDLLNAVLYQQVAAEYRASSLQSFAQAKLALEKSLADKSVTAAEEQVGNFQQLPPAVVVDVDETMLDNSAYQARLIVDRDKDGYTEETWNAWVAEAQALEVPGAVAFSQFAAAKGVRVMYLSNRDVKTTEITRVNLDKVGFADAKGVDNFFFRDKVNGFDTKGSRRAAIAKKYRIVMLIGDNLGDFTEQYKQSSEQRSKLIDDTTAWWGSRWIMIPNPSYGSWEQALSNYERDLPAERVRADKHKALRLQRAAN
jgi:5'-nucleotidase (lipoprotein e(P4) family)